MADKKQDSARNRPLDVGEPPIIVTGGGGRRRRRLRDDGAKDGSKRHILRGSNVDVEYDDTNGVHKHRKPQHDTSQDITRAVVELTTTNNGQTTTRPYTMISDDEYEISITFYVTDSANNAKAKNVSKSASKGSKASARSRR